MECLSQSALRVRFPHRLTAGDNRRPLDGERHSGGNRTATCADRSTRKDPRTQQSRTSWAGIGTAADARESPMLGEIMLVGYVSDERFVAIADVTIEFERDGETVACVHSTARGKVIADIEPGDYRVT